MAYTLLIRQGCGLCEEARRGLEALGLPFETQDIDRAPALFSLYTFRVPVLLKDQQPVMEGHFDHALLSKLLSTEATWIPT